MIMAFIWSGEVKQSKYHLARWEVIFRPEGNGLWGLKNLHHFFLALREKSLWLFIARDGMWSKVIKGKYFPRSSTIQWIRNFKKPGRNISNIWASLMGAFNLLSSWLAWSPGDGSTVYVGEDPIVGGPVSYTLTRDLIFFLDCKGFYSLYHIASPPSRGSTIQG